MKLQDFLGRMYNEVDDKMKDKYFAELTDLATLRMIQLFLDENLNDERTKNKFDNIIKTRIQEILNKEVEEV